MKFLFLYLALTTTGLEPSLQNDASCCAKQHFAHRLGSISSSQTATLRRPDATLNQVPVLVASNPYALWVPVPIANPYAFALLSHIEQVRDVSMHDDYFSPSTVSVQPGTLVRFRNKGRHVHTITFGPWVDLGPIVPGGEILVPCWFPGTYYFYCRIHPYSMRGSIFVY